LAKAIAGEEYNEGEQGTVNWEDGEIFPGQTDRLITSREYGHTVGKNNVMPFRLIFPKNGKYAALRLRLSQLIQKGKLDFHHVRFGAFSVVGFQDFPVVDKASGEEEEVELAFKYFDYVHHPEKKDFEKSEVTGVGQYILSRLIEKDTPIQVPEPVFATNGIYVTESVRGGKTLREVMNNKEHGEKWKNWWLGGGGYPGMQSIVYNAVEKVIKDNDDPYWKPDYKEIDIHEGNIILTPNCHKNPPPTNESDDFKCFYLIDPIK